MEHDQRQRESRGVQQRCAGGHQCVRARVHVCVCVLCTCNVSYTRRDTAFGWTRREGIQFAPLAHIATHTHTLLHNAGWMERGRESWPLAVVHSPLMHGASCSLALYSDPMILSLARVPLRLALSEANFPTPKHGGPPYF